MCKNVLNVTSDIRKNVKILLKNIIKLLSVISRPLSSLHDYMLITSETNCWKLNGHPALAVYQVNDDVQN